MVRSAVAKNLRNQKIINAVFVSSCQKESLIP